MQRAHAEAWWWFWSKVCWILAGWLAISLLATLSVLLAGCGTKKTPPPALPAKPVAATPAPPIAPPATTPHQPAPELTTGNQTDESESSPDPPETPASPAPPTFATERILVLAPRNPLIVEFQLTIDGQPHARAMDHLVEVVLKLADTDGDGRPTWKEIAESKRFKYGQFGNLPIAGDNEFKQISERYDIDRDGAVDAGELPRFLTRNAGSARAFSVRGTADFRTAIGGGSPLWRLLDADGDNLISAEERAAAPGRMATRDTDDDEILLAGDLNPRVPLDMGLMGQRIRRGGVTVVRLLGAYANWDSVRLSLEEHYSGNGYLRPDCFPLTPELFTELDANHDGKLLKGEFEGLNRVPPHLVIAATFGSPKAAATNQPEAVKPETVKPEAPAKEDPVKPEAKESADPVKPEAQAKENADPVKPESPAEDDPRKPEAQAKELPSGPQLKLVHILPALANPDEPILEQPGRLTLTIAGTPITFYLNDTVAGGDFAAQAQQALTSLDADKNGYLEAKELPASAAPQLGQFEAVDADEDGKVYPAEISAFLQQQQAGLRAQIHAKVSDREDPLFAYLDQNHDERLDARELEATPDRLGQLDASGDGLISADEVPELLIVGLARGNLEAMDALFVPPPPAVRAPATDLPRWFTAMDANGDGGISDREFLGPLEKFKTLDTTGDGLVDAAEAKAVQ